MDFDSLVAMFAGQDVSSGRCVDVEHSDSVSGALLVEREDFSPDKTNDSRWVSRRVVKSYVVRINIYLVRGADCKKGQGC